MEQDYSYASVCFEAWMNMENCIICINKNGWSDKSTVLKYCEEGASFLAGVFFLQDRDPREIESFVAAGMPIVEECALACQPYADIPTFAHCAASCHQLSQVISQYFLPAMAS